MWSNWSGGQRSQPRATVRPLDEAGVRAAVRRSAERGQRIRPVGAGGSFSPLALPDEIALDLSALTGLVRVGGDRVRVRAGTTLSELNTTLAEHGLAVAALTDVELPSVAGAIGTGTHGSYPRSGSLSAQVSGLRMVSGSGAAFEVPADELDAARTGLGALGVVTEVELRVVPEPVLQVGYGRLTLDEALADEHLDGHEWAEFSAFPYAEDALGRWADPAADSEPRARSAMRTLERRLVRSARDITVGGGVVLGRTVPKLVPRINRVATRWGGSGPVIEPVVDFAHRALAVRPVVRWEESEWALPRAALGPAVRELLTAISERGLDVGFPLEVRVGAAETGWLHPAQGRDTGWVAVHAPAGGDPEPLFTLASAVLAAHDGRPHWGKWHPWTVAEVARAYPRLDDFRAVRDRHDPRRVFTNPHLDTVLGP
jgi:L-gulono-1,4-lactone dehydrogenase